MAETWSDIKLNFALKHSQLISVLPQPRSSLIYWKPPARVPCKPLQEDTAKSQYLDVSTFVIVTSTSIGPLCLLVFISLCLLASMRRRFNALTELVNGKDHERPLLQPEFTETINSPADPERAEQKHNPQFQCEKPKSHSKVDENGQKSSPTEQDFDESLAKTGAEGSNLPADPPDAKHKYNSKSQLLDPTNPGKEDPESPKMTLCLMGREVKHLQAIKKEVEEILSGRKPIIKINDLSASKGIFAKVGGIDFMGASRVMLLTTDNPRHIYINENEDCEFCKEYKAACKSQKKVILVVLGHHDSSHLDNNALYHSTLKRGHEHLIEDDRFISLGYAGKNLQIRFNQKQRKAIDNWAK